MDELFNSRILVHHELQSWKRPGVLTFFCALGASF
jgi:hypothetical protein